MGTVHLKKKCPQCGVLRRGRSGFVAKTWDRRPDGVLVCGFCLGTDPRIKSNKDRPLGPKVIDKVDDLIAEVGGRLVVVTAVPLLNALLEYGGDYQAIALDPAALDSWSSANEIEWRLEADVVVLSGAPAPGRIKVKREVLKEACRRLYESREARKRSDPA